MNVARDKKTGRIIEADELKLLFEVDQDNYECVDKNCRVKMTPASFKPTNKNRPHFKTARGHDHSDQCTFNEYLSLLEKAKTRRVSFGKIPYPSKLKSGKKLDDIIKPKVSEKSSADASSTSSTVRSDGWLETEDSNRSVSSLNQIVDFYISCPYNRDFKLDILGYETEYQYWFKKVEFNRSNDGTLYKGRRVFMGTLNLNKDSITQSEEEIKIKLMECEAWKKPLIRFFADEKKIQKNPYSVIVNTADLSNNKISRLLNQLNFVKEEHVGDFKNETDRKDVQAKVFFLADPPSEEEPYLFNVIDAHLVSRYCKIPKTVSE